MKMAEEFAVPSTEELNNLEAWGNTQAGILTTGRTVHMAPEGLDEEARDAYIAEMGEKDAAPERFRAIQEHTPMAGLDFSWVKKIVGDSQ